MEPLELPKLVRDLIRAYIELQKPFVMLSPTIEDDKLVFRTNPKDFIVTESISLVTHGQNDIEELSMMINNNMMFCANNHTSQSLNLIILGDVIPLHRVFSFLSFRIGDVMKSTHPIEIVLKTNTPNNNYRISYTRVFPDRIN